MCFVKTKTVDTTPAQIDPVERKEANASLTKTSDIEKNKKTGFEENIKTSAQGILEEANVSKKQLLGE